MIENHFRVLRKVSDLTKAVFGEDWSPGDTRGDHGREIEAGRGEATRMWNGGHQ